MKKNMDKNIVEQLIKIKGIDNKEYFAKVIMCENDECNRPSTLHLTQDDKFYCDKHGKEKVGSFIKAVNSLGGFV